MPKKTVGTTIPKLQQLFRQHGPAGKLFTKTAIFINIYNIHDTKRSKIHNTVTALPSVKWILQMKYQNQQSSHHKKKF